MRNYFFCLGKTYFYNCKTEISQWEKPKGWPLDESNRTSTSTISSTDRIKKGFVVRLNLFLFYSNIESTTNVPPTVRTRYKMEESSSHQKLSQNRNSNNHHNENQTFQESNEQLHSTSNNRLPSPGLFHNKNQISVNYVLLLGDDSSRMSFSSTSSKESSLLVAPNNIKNESNGVVLHSSFSEPGKVNTNIYKI